MTKVVDQVDIFWTTAAQMMRTKAFRRGFDDKRAGRKFSYDSEPEGEPVGDYENGRQLATVAPVGMPLMIGRRLNPKALALFQSLKLGWW
jgi:hypothetical protein